MAQKDQQRSNRRKAERRGHRAEILAAWWLRLKGFSIKECRFKTPVGEVDLIARRGNLVLFVEVKARVDHRTALDSVGYRSQQRIEKSARLWLSQQTDFSRLSWRFDVIAISPWKLPHHFQNVWSG